MNRLYETPSLDINEFEDTDIVTTSGLNVNNGPGNFQDQNW